MQNSYCNHRNFDSANQLLDYRKRTFIWLTPRLKLTRNVSTLHLQRVCHLGSERIGNVFDETKMQSRGRLHKKVIKVKVTGDPRILKLKKKKLFNFLVARK